METVLSDTGKEAEGPISSALGMEPDGKHATMAVSPLRRAHIDWSIYDKVTVSFAFMRQLTFHGMKRYVTIGQFRELVAQELLLPSTHVALEIDGLQLLVNTITLEDALGQGRLHLHMVRAASSSTRALAQQQRRHTHSPQVTARTHSRAWRLSRCVARARADCGSRT